jgi:two-component system, OmpR family, alkaline phosphatase synthesis response regulator PhoP
MPELRERFDMANSCATILCMRSPDFEKRASGRSLLVVEDDADIREALDGLLSMEGFRVAGCSNGREALDWLRASPKPDIILLDLMMPKLSGFEICQRLRMDPATNEIGVLMITALDQPTDVEKAVGAGTDDFMTKPINRTELLLRVRALLESRIQSSELDRTLAYMGRVQQGL